MDQILSEHSDLEWGLRASVVIACEEFLRRIADITYDDYGDFMREANLYLDDLREELSIMPAALEAVDDMQGYTQFHSTWNVEETRQRLLRDAAALKKRFEHRSLLPNHEHAWRGAWTRPMKIDENFEHPFTVARMTDHNVRGRD